MCASALYICNCICVSLASRAVKSVPYTHTRGLCTCMLPSAPVWQRHENSLDEPPPGCLVQLLRPVCRSHHKHPATQHTRHCQHSPSVCQHPNAVAWRQVLRPYGTIDMGVCLCRATLVAEPGPRVREHAEHDCSSRVHSGARASWYTAQPLCNRQSSLVAADIRILTLPRH